MILLNIFARLKKKKVKLFELNPKGYVSYRIKPETENLKEEDYRFGFGINNHLYQIVKRKREALGLPTNKDYLGSWDSREGFSIEGKPLPTGYHPLHDKKLINSKGETYIIDAVHEHHYFGKYLVLLIRKEGTKSHGVRYWENFTCKNPTIIEGIKEAHEEYKIKED